MLPSICCIHDLDTFPGFFFSQDILGHQQTIGYQISPFCLILEASICDRFHFPTLVQQIFAQQLSVTQVHFPNKNILKETPLSAGSLRGARGPLAPLHPPPQGGALQGAGVENQGLWEGHRRRRWLVKYIQKHLQSEQIKLFPESSSPIEWPPREATDEAVELIRKNGVSVLGPVRKIISY